MPQEPELKILSSRPLEDDLKIIASHVQDKKDVPHDVVSRLAEWLPAAGGAAGGIIGGIGGTVAGMGVGGWPGAVGGAAVGGATGEAAKRLAQAWRGTTPPAQAGGTVMGDMARAAGGIAGEGAIQGGMEALGGAVPKVGKHVAGVLMQSAVKPGIKNTAKALARGVEKTELPIIKTLLNEGVNVSAGGIAKLDRIISSTNKEIADAISSLPGSVNPEAVAMRTKSVAEAAANQVNPGSDVSAVEHAVQEFLTQPKTTQMAQVGTKQVPRGVLDASGEMLMKSEPVMGRVPRALSLPESQSLKTGTYRSLKEKAYGELKAPAIEAQKALARGLKEEIELEAQKSGVSLAGKNAREGAAIEGKEAIARRLAAAGNQDPIALAWLAAHPATGLLYIMEKSPMVKSLLARGLYRSAVLASSKKVPVTENMLRLMVQSIATMGEPMASHEQEPQ